MGALSFANAISLLKKKIDLLDETEKFGASAGTNYDTLFDTFIAANIGDYPDLCAATGRAHRAMLAGMLGPATVRAILEHELKEVGAAINAPERDPVNLLYRLREYMLAQAPDETINAREFSRGTPSAGGSNVGNGNLRRLTKDEDDYPLEASTAETKTLEVLLDQNQVDKHREEAELRGAKPEPDLIKYVGSGTVGRLKALSYQDSEAYVVNPSFNQLSGTQPSAGSEATPAATTSVTGWTLTSASNARVSVDLFYRDKVGETKTYSLRFTADNKAVQAIVAQRRARLPTRSPVYVQVAIYRKDTCDGNTIIRWGAKTITTANSSLSDNAWNIITITLDKYCWYKNIKEDALTIEVELASRTTGSIYIDDVIVAPFTYIDGSYWALVGGATAFLEGDTFTIADTESATRGVIQYWLMFRSGWADQLQGICLPAVTGAAETITDP